MTPAELRFVEDVGVFLEDLGTSRMTGRVWATLLLADEPSLTAADLADRLEVSAGSVSNATRLLLGLGMIERRRVPGDRKDHFSVHPDSYITLVRAREQSITRFSDLLAGGLRTVDDGTPAHRRLADFHRFYVWLADRFHHLIDEWQIEESARRQDEA